MPYTYTAFGSVELPIYNTEQDHAPGRADTALLNTPNGPYDPWQSTRRIPRAQQIPLSGILYDESNLLITEDNDFLVDESGNIFTQGATGDTLRAQIDAIKAMLGRRDQLWRQDSETLTLRWKYARLLAVDHKRTFVDKLRYAPIGLLFETADATWRSASATTTIDSLSSGANTVTVDVLGAENVTDAIIRITADTTITSVQIELGDADLTWTGTLSTGELMIDTGALTITNNGADAYDGLSLGAGHIVPGWLLLLPESNELTVTVDAAGDIEIEHYDQWT